ncbi:MAG: chloramphenicol acetyltransferase [Clostridia bacterium]|nr:chloramphenicol acetyltransferase [Clostridia bacterium]
MKEIDIQSWNRKKQFLWFNSFSNPCYCINVKMDCTKVVNICKENKKSFFVSFMYLVMKALNSIEEFRLRYIDGKVYLFDTINPAFTVMTDAGVFENVRHEMKEDFVEFYDLSKKVIDEAKKEIKVKDEYNTNNFNEYYLTTTPWLDFESATHPIPDDKNSLSVPRICWGKYKKVDDKYLLTLNINVSHALVDGKPMCEAFNKIQDLLDRAEEFLRW